MSAMSDYARLFDDAYGRLRREDPAALFAAMDNAAAKVIPKVVVVSKPLLPRRPRKALGDFKRDLLGKNVLIGKRWGVRGTVVMIVSSTGTGKSAAVLFPSLKAIGEGKVNLVIAAEDIGSSNKRRIECKCRSAEVKLIFYSEKSLLFQMI